MRNEKREEKKSVDNDLGEKKGRNGKGKRKGALKMRGEGGLKKGNKRKALK
jgi:hypothetical protein